MYTTTRSKMNVRASKAICDGIASDGGLYIYKRLKKVKFNSDWLELSYQEICVKIFKIFFNNFSLREIREIVSKAYARTNFNERIVGFDSFDKFAFLTLYHGPTMAFKDMALTVLPLLMEKALKKEKKRKKTVILTATSGDTGGAALSGFLKTKIKTIVLYPNNNVSLLQEKQMHYYKRNENLVIAIDGNFDDCQRIVKEAFKEIKDDNVNLSSANSINIGRLVPQIIYYFYGYLCAVKNEKIAFGEKINVSVPTGNFGNVFACFVAKEMGCPIDKLLVSSNENNVLTEFFETGIYNANRPFSKTISPSMDILISSNLERLLYLKSNKDFKKVKLLMEELKTSGKFKIDEELHEALCDFYGGYLTEEETSKMIKEVFDEYKYLIDPHTAVAYGVYQKYKKENPSRFTLIISTANPYKFSQSIGKIFNIEEEDVFKQIEEISKKTNFKASKNILNLKDVKVKKEIINKEEALAYLRKVISKV